MSSWADEADRFGCAATLFDDDRRLVTASANFQQWLGRDATGEGIEHILTRGSSIYWETNIMPILDGQGHAHDVALELNGAQGKVSLLAFVVVDATGFHILWVPFQHRDRFERSLASAEERRRKDEAELKRLEAADAMRTDFINSVAHEMGTPMTPIQIQMRILKGLAGDAGPDIQRAVAKMAKSLDTLNHFHEELLEAAQLQADRTTIPVAEARLDPIVQAALAEWHATTPRSGPVEFDGEPCPAQVNEATLQDCLRRLLENADRFSPPDSTIRVEVRVDPPRISVIDAGRGIDPERIGRLGRPFAKGHTDRESSLLGAGLGLYIVASRMHAMHGALRLRSQGEGKGTTATLTFDA